MRRKHAASRELADLLWEVRGCLHMAQKHVRTQIGSRIMAKCISKFEKYIHADQTMTDDWEDSGKHAGGKP